MAFPSGLVKKALLREHGDDITGAFVAAATQEVAAEAGLELRHASIAPWAINTYETPVRTHADVVFLIRCAERLPACGGPQHAHAWEVARLDPGQGGVPSDAKR